MPGHFTTRVLHQATTPIVREAGPVVAGLFKTFAQFAVFMCVGCAVLVLAYFVSGEIPEQVLKSAMMVIGLGVFGFGTLVVGDMVYMTYRKVPPTVYPTVEAFEDREPM